MLSITKSFQVWWHSQVKVKEWKKLHLENTKLEKAGVAILLLDEVVFRAKEMTRANGDIIEWWPNAFPKKT